MTFVFYMKPMSAKRTMRVACNLRASCVELCNEAVIAWWRTMAGDFECACACTTRKYILSQTWSAKWENKPTPRLQFRAAHSCSLDFMSSQLHVFTTCAIPNKRRRHCKCARLFATSALLECHWEHSREVRDDRLNCWLNLKIDKILNLG
jgi:hypothetical protein